MSSLHLPRFFGWSTSEVAQRQIQQKQQQQQKTVRDRSPRKRDDSLHLWNILGYTKQPDFWREVVTQVMRGCKEETYGEYRLSLAEN